MNWFTKFFGLTEVATADELQEAKNRLRVCESKIKMLDDSVERLERQVLMLMDRPPLM